MNLYTLGYEGLDVAAFIACLKRAAVRLVCFEADFNRCHRNFVGQAAVALGAPALEHLARDVAGADGQSRLFD
jgi:uncharacterized protein (DUF488 family)